MKSQITTFYSYKGGAGRTMSLANVSILLCQWGYNVLVLDWDLEAPGLEHFFSQFIDVEDIQKKTGIVDLLSQASSEEYTVTSEQWNQVAIDIPVPDCKGKLSLIPAGRRDQDYFLRVKSFDIHEFYQKRNGGEFFENARKSWLQNYDHILIDSRTGITDLGGICTIQLPDFLISPVTPTDQSVKGILDVNHKAQLARQKMPFERMNLVTIPIPSRVDSQNEFEISKRWLDRMAEDFTELYANWLPTSVSKRKLLDLLKLPYISYFGFGEKLPVLEQGTDDPAGLGYAYETIASLIGSGFDNVELLMEERSQLIRSSKKKIPKEKKSIFISHNGSNEDKNCLQRLEVHLKSFSRFAKIKITSSNGTMIRRNHKLEMEVLPESEKVDIAILLVTPGYLASRPIQEAELPILLERYRKKELTLVPILLKPIVMEFFPELSKIQFFPAEGKPLLYKGESEIEDNIILIVKRIAEMLEAE